jgi:hypothetical protein
MARNSRDGYGFGLGGPLPALSPTPVISTRAPLTSDINFELGTTWINTNTNQAWTMTGSAAGAATWSLSSPGASDVDTLTGDAGGAISPVAGNINILGGATTTITGAGNTLTVNANANGYPVSPYVVGAVGEGGYATIQAALTAADASGSDHTVIVQPGTYNENLTMFDGINIQGSVYGDVIITGAHTPPAAGTLVIQNCTLTSATDIFTSAVAGTTVITLEDCFINVTNGYVFDLVNWTGDLNMFECGDGSTNNGWINNTGGADVTMAASDAGNGTGNAYVLSGDARLRYSDIRCPGTFQGSGTVDTASCVFTGTITTAATVDVLLANGVIQTGANQALTHGSAGETSLGNMIINTSNVTAIGGAGAGNLNIENVIYEDVSVIAGTITQNYPRMTNRVSNYVVGPSGNFATIQAALDAADASAIPQTVIIQPGAYTENLTLYDDVHMRGSSYVDVLITGVHTPPAAGDIQIQNCSLLSATDIFTSAVAGTTNITLEDCFINVTNGYVFDMVNWTGDLSMFECGDGSTNNGWINNTGGSAILIAASDVGNGVGNAYVISGNARLRYSDIRCPGTFQGVGPTVDTVGCTFTGTITTAGGAIVDLANGVVDTGATQAITHGSTGALTLGCEIIDTSNNPAIGGAGAGNLILESVQFEQNAVLAGTLTQAFTQTTTGLIDATGAHLINSGAGNDITFTMGDNAGANNVAFNDLAGNPVFTIDSNGGIGTLAGLTVAGNFAQTAGTFNVGQDNAANAINIGGGNVARAIGIANSAAAHTLTLGNAALGAITMDTGAGFSIDGANTSNITVTSAGLDLNIQGVGCAVNMTSSEAQNDAIHIDATAANGGVQIHAGTGGILIGDEADTAGITIGNIAPTQNRTIVIGSGTVVTAAVTDDISIGDGGATTNVNSIKHVDINNGGVTLGEVNTFIACGAVTSGTHATEICTGNRAAGTMTLDMLTGTGVKTLSIGNADNLTVLNIDAVTTLGGGLTSDFVTRTGDVITFTQSPLTCTAANTGGVATGATGDLNLLSFQEGVVMEQFVLGAGQTIIKPVMTATGLLISGDETATEGFEYNFGAARANSRHSFTIGTSPAFFLEWSFRADDISGLEPCYCGFRRTQANQAVGNIALYTDFVAYGLNDGIAPGDAAISTQLNTGGLVNTDTNDAWADTATHTLRINVSAAGVVTFLFDGGAPTVTQAYTFDNGDVVHPFFRHEFNAVLPDAIEWVSMQIGFQ